MKSLVSITKMSMRDRGDQQVLLGVQEAIGIFAMDALVLWNYTMVLLLWTVWWVFISLLCIPVKFLFFKFQF